MTGIVILAIAIGAACIRWVALDIRRRVTSLVFWPFPTLVAIRPVGLVTYGILSNLIEKRR